MNFERALDTQRLRLLRILAGLVAVVAFMSARPFSRDVSRWMGGVVASILSRAELAAQYLVIAQARVLAARLGSDVDQRQLSDCTFRDVAESASRVSLVDLRHRLDALRALLEDLPRYGLRLLRRAEKALRRMLHGRRAEQPTPCPDIKRSRALCDWRLAEARIERPPDKTRPATATTDLPR